MSRSGIVDCGWYAVHQQENMVLPLVRNPYRRRENGITLTAQGKQLRLQSAVQIGRGLLLLSRGRGGRRKARSMKLCRHIPLILPSFAAFHFPARYATVANTGSVGLSYDGDRRGSYLLLDDSKPTIRRVEYDVDRELKTLADCSLPHAD